MQNLLKHYKIQKCMSSYLKTGYNRKHINFYSFSIKKSCCKNYMVRNLKPIGNKYKKHHKLEISFVLHLHFDTDLSS